MLTRLRPPLLALLLVATASAIARGDDSARLLVGVRAFRAGDYAQAVAIFRELEHPGGPADLPLYLGPSLYKLGRDHEARAVLAPFHRGPDRDPVADYYLGLVYHRLGLVRLARKIFVSLDAAAAGPKLAEGAARFVAAIDAQPYVGVGVQKLLSRVAEVEHSDPDLAFDDACEAYLRAATSSPDRARAAALVTRLALVVGAPAVAQELVDAPAQPR